MSSKIVVFHVPEDKKLLSAIGAVTLRHEHLNHILKMTIKSIAGLTPSDAFHALKYESSRSLRKKIYKLGKKQLGEGETLLKLQAILGRAERATDKRNEYIHSIWAKELDGDPGIVSVSGKLNPLPTIEELEDLGKEIEGITQELNQARLEGFLAEALNDNPRRAQ